MRSEQRKHESGREPGDAESKPGDGEQKAETTPAQERGERIETGKAISRGGKEAGRVLGAEPSPNR